MNALRDMALKASWVHLCLGSRGGEVADVVASVRAEVRSLVLFCIFIMYLCCVCAAMRS